MSVNSNRNAEGENHGRADFSQAQELIALYGLNVIAAVAILIIGRLAANIVKKVIESIMMKTKVDVTLVSFVASLSYVALMAFVVIAALGQLGIQTTSFIAVLGAAGLAVGLALQGSLSNFAAGVLMIIFKPFKVGDYIEGGGASGIANKIEIFTTTLKSPDNKTIIVPNSKIGGGTSSIIRWNTPASWTCRRFSVTRTISLRLKNMSRKFWPATPGYLRSCAGRRDCEIYRDPRHLCRAGVDVHRRP